MTVSAPLLFFSSPNGSLGFLLVFRGSRGYFLENSVFEVNCGRGLAYSRSFISKTMPQMNKDDSVTQ